MSNPNHGRKQVMTSKLAQSKVYNYIKKVEIDGLPRVRAYAEAIDPRIYDLAPNQISNKLDHLSRDYPGFRDLKDMVLAEQRDWQLRNSSIIQNKALELLSNLVDKANQIATDPDVDVKELNVAVSTLRSIMPAFTAIGNKTSVSDDSADKKRRASNFIN